MTYTNDVYTKYCFTIRDYSLLGNSSMQAKIGELWIEMHFANSFLYSFLCVLMCSTLKLKVV